MTTKPDTKPDRNRLRAATLVALTTAVVAALLLGTAASASAVAKRKTTKPLVAPSVSVVDGVTCTDLGDGTWDVTVRFKTNGGRYLNLGSPADTDALDGPRDNVYGGTRYVESTVHYLGFPGYVDDHSIAISGTFTYQHLVAPTASKSQEVANRSMRVLTRDFEVTFTCA